MLKMMLKPGDFQFINNRTILHGRAHFEDHEAKDQRRHLYRLWLNVPEWPRMPASQSTLVGRRHGALGCTGGAASRGDAGLGVLIWRVPKGIL
jgi:hypothetical protein